MKTVDAYIEGKPEWADGLKALRRLMLDLPFEEHIKWNAPVYTAYGRNLVGLSAFKHHFGLWFFEGASLGDKAGVLQNAQKGKTKYMRQWKFAQKDELDLPLIKEYLEETLRQAKANPAPLRKQEVKPVSTLVSEIFAEALRNEPDLKQAFSAFTPYKQKEFAEYISEAKREATQVKRLEKVREMILRGEGLNDRYR